MTTEREEFNKIMDKLVAQDYIKEINGVSSITRKGKKFIKSFLTPEDWTVIKKTRKETQRELNRLKKDQVKA
jgi:predicted transcriptional regulator